MGRGDVLRGSLPWGAGHLSADRVVSLWSRLAQGHALPSGPEWSARPPRSAADTTVTGVWPEAPAGPGTAGLTPTPRALLPWGERENVLTRGTSAVSGRQDGVSVLRTEAAEARAGVPSAGDRDTRHPGSTERLKREAAERPGPSPGTQEAL